MTQSEVDREERRGHSSDGVEVHFRWGRLSAAGGGCGGRGDNGYGIEFLSAGRSGLPTMPVAGLVGWWEIVDTILQGISPRFARLYSERRAAVDCPGAAVAGAAVTDVLLGAQRTT